MLPAYEKIKSDVNSSFYVNDLVLNHFQSPLHFHPEVEILYVKEGTGTRFVGDSVQSFATGDLVIVGSDTPHVWLNDKKYYEKDSTLKANAIYIQFRPDVFGNEFTKLPEMRQITALLNISKQGIKFPASRSENIIDMLESIINETGLSRLNTLLSILQAMAENEYFEYLNLPDNSYNSNHQDMLRITKVYEYVMANFHDDIRLEKVAGVASLTPQSFCRYFKQRANKNFSRFLNEVRIGHACKLLIERELSVSDIAYESGFNHFSSFNKQFKSIMKMTALQYQKKYRTLNTQECS